MTAEEILARAADRVEFGKWTQGASFGDGIVHPVCMAGAVSAVHHEAMASPAFTAGAWLAATQAILTEIGMIKPNAARDYVLMGRWNDAPGRTAIEVATALRNAKRHLPVEDERGSSQSTSGYPVGEDVPSRGSLGHGRELSPTAGGHE